MIVLPQPFSLKNKSFSVEQQQLYEEKALSSVLWSWRAAGAEGSQSGSRLGFQYGHHW